MDLGDDHPPVPMEPTEIAAKVQFNNHRESLVQIVAQRRTGGSGRRATTESHFIGSGFIIGKTQNNMTLMVITCDHVIRSLKDNQSLKVRLFGSSEDLEATVSDYDTPMDLALLRVVVQSISNHPIIRLTTATDKVPRTIVVLVGNYNPVDALKKVLKEPRPLFPTEPSAVGGIICGIPVDKGDEGILINHTCYGMRGCSGSPIIHHETSHALAVFQGNKVQVHDSIASETVKQFLKNWLHKNDIAIEDNVDFETTIARCVMLF